MIINNTVSTWSLTIDEYKTGEWGSAVGGFRVPASVQKRFRKINTTTQADEGFDYLRAFKNLAQTYINAICTRFEFLREVDFRGLPSSVRRKLRFAVYNAMEFSLLNNQTWERIDGSSITTPNFTMSADQVNWFLSADMIGQKAWNYIIESRIDRYRLVGEQQAQRLTRNGNVIFMSKFEKDEINWDTDGPSYWKDNY